MLTCQKHLFSLPEDVHYLNCAYMSPLARPVEAAGIEGMQRKRVPSTITPAMFFDESNRARQLFGQLINAEAQRIALIPAASYGIAIVARNLEVHREQNLVVLHEQFPSNIYTWHRLAQETGAEIRAIRPPSSHPRGTAWNERILDRIDANTALVALPNVHWADGTRFDLEAIGRRARDVGAAFVIDGTQSVGALSIDVQQLQPDALICAAYKWLLGPYSIGVAYLGPRFDDGTPLEENWIGRLGSERFGELVNYQEAYQPGALRYDVGERSNFALVPMMNAGLELVLRWGPDAIQAYCSSLTQDLLQEAQDLGFVLEAESRRGAHLFGIRVPDHLSMDRLHEALSLRNISVSVRGDAIRISPHVYNEARDIDALRDALHATLKPSTAVHPTS